MKLLMMSNYSANNKAVMQLTMKNHIDYCCKWGIDCIYTTGPYSAHNDFDQLCNFKCQYDKIITVGTDILFTNMEKDIRDFCTDHFITIQLQHEEGTSPVNGDFIIWSINEELLEKLKLIDPSYWSTQETINRLKHVNQWKQHINVLPCRQLQGIMQTPWIPAKSLEHPEGLWQPGDFSAHAYTPGEHVRPPAGYKERALNWFIREHPQFN